MELHALPNDIATDVPQTRDYRYTVAHDRVVLVSPLDRVVVGVFTDGSVADARVGKR